jgi:NADPH-dependent 2,4-dienoyl-CoA reductase/sulfur reductase-like enzyme
VGREKEAEIKPAENPKNVAVIGGGVAGMEAAAIAAMRGHTVDLYEREGSLGGQIKVAAIPPTRQEISFITDHLEYQLKKWDVKVLCGTEVTEDILKSLKADVVILATGYLPVRPDLPGFDGKNVFSAEEVLSGKASVSNGLTAIIGGGLVGCETADFLGERGHRAIIFKASEEIAADTGRATKVYLEDKLEQLGVEVLTGAEVMRIEGNTLFYEQMGKEQAFSGIDTFIIAKGYRTHKPLKNCLDALDVSYYDLVQEKGNLLKSIHKAFWVAHAI